MILQTAQWPRMSNDCGTHHSTTCTPNRRMTGSTQLSSALRPTRDAFSKSNLTFYWLAPQYSLCFALASKSTITVVFEGFELRNAGLSCETRQTSTLYNSNHIGAAKLNKGSPGLMSGSRGPRKEDFARISSDAGVVDIIWNVRLGRY